MAKTEFAELFANGLGTIPEDILEQKEDLVNVDEFFPKLTVDGQYADLLNPNQLRRLTRGYVQEQRRKKVVKIPVYLDNGEFLKFKQEVQIVEGRIRIRRNSHDRSWYGKYPKEGKPRKWVRILQASQEVFEEHVFEGHNYTDLIPVGEMTFRESSEVQSFESTSMEWEKSTVGSVLVSKLQMTGDAKI